MNGVLEAYIAGFRETLIVGIAFAGAAVIASAGFRLMSIKETRRIEGQETEGEERFEGVVKQEMGKMK